MTSWWKVFLIAGFLTVLSNSYAYSSEKQNVYIELQVEDVTGDKIKDQIVIKGVPNNSNSIDLKNVSLEIRSRNVENESIKLSLPDGSKPVLSLFDLNHDGVKDVFVTIQPIDREDTVRAFCYTFKEGKVVDLEAPHPVSTEASFQNGYKAVIKAGNKTFKVDVSTHKKMYEKMGMYHNGKLNEPIELMVNDYSKLQPTYILQGRGVVGFQKISGAYESDVLGVLKSTWFYQSGEWKLKNVTFKSSPKHT